MKFKLTLQYPAETIAIGQIINMYDKLDPHMEKYQLAALLRDEYHTGGWEKVDADMIALSIDFPTVIFMLNIYDEKLDTMGSVLYFKDGKFYQEDLIVTSPPYDEGKLQ